MDADPDPTECMLSPDDEALLAGAGLMDLPLPSEGLFRADGWLRRVSSENVLLFGGGRALLLEVAHPLVAAGVAQHSNFRTDPFGRLQRTLDAMGTITFKDRAAACAAARRVERAHLKVRGVLSEASGPYAAGTPYAGRDPELMLWVWATLVDTALAVYERFVAELDPVSRESYYAEQRVVARVLGVPAALVPADYAAFADYFEAMLASETLCVSAEARAISEAVLNPPGGGVPASLVQAITAALLPARLREAFGLTWDSARSARVEALAASVRALRQKAGSVDAPGNPR